eukprot:jgi/Mesvir1/1501/Mv14484-RA.1
MEENAFDKGMNLAQWESTCQAAEGGAMWRFLYNSCAEGIDYRHADAPKSVWDFVSDPNSPSFRVADIERRNVLLTPQCLFDFLVQTPDSRSHDEGECSLSQDRKRLGRVESLFVSAMTLKSVSRELRETVAALREQIGALTERMDALEARTAANAATI